MIKAKTKANIKLEDYRGIIEETLYNDLKKLSSELNGLKVCHINATSYGGGVAEILHQLVPLANDLGIETDWKIMEGNDPFFDVTKKVHNALQGQSADFSKEEWQTYENCNVEMGKRFNPKDYDVVFIHDPQPAMLPHCYDKNATKWVWRCHIDTSTPNKEALNYFNDLLSYYNAYIFTMRQFVFKGLKDNVFILPPAIDPLSDKNKIISKEEAKKIVKRFGINVSRPLVTQVSRFDPWKDPKGVVDAYRIAKKKFPDLQLLYAGSMASDDPEGWEIIKDFKNYIGEDKDVYVLSNLDGVGNIEINAFQTYSDIVLQKSLKEGFGLTVSEALWKGVPVIGGNVGGIPTQIIDGKTGFLVDSVEECGEKIIYLLENKDEAKRMGTLGREHVRKKFLLPNLLLNEMKVIELLLGKIPV